MKATALLFTLLLTLLTGCVLPGGNSATVEVFRDGRKPTKPYREIQVLTDDGGLNEQSDIEGKMIFKARYMGANGIIFKPLARVGRELQGLHVVDTYLFKGVVIQYR